MSRPGRSASCLRRASRSAARSIARWNVQRQPSSSATIRSTAARSAAAVRVEEAEHELLGARGPQLAAPPARARRRPSAARREAVRQPQHHAQRDVDGGTDPGEGLHGRGQPVRGHVGDQLQPVRTSGLGGDRVLDAEGDHLQDCALAHRTPSVGSRRLLLAPLEQLDSRGLVQSEAYAHEPQRRRSLNRRTCSAPPPPPPANSYDGRAGRRRGRRRPLVPPPPAAPQYSRTSVAPSPMYRPGGRTPDHIPQPQRLVQLVDVRVERHQPPLAAQPREQRAARTAAPAPHRPRAPQGPPGHPRHAPTPRARPRPAPRRPRRSHAPASLIPFSSSSRTRAFVQSPRSAMSRSFDSGQNTPFPSRPSTTRTARPSSARAPPAPSTRDIRRSRSRSRRRGGPATAESARRARRSGAARAARGHVRHVHRQKTSCLPR